MTSYANEKTIKVMSQNLRCADDPNGNSIAERAPRFLSMVTDFDPDLIGTQETTARWNAIIDNDYSEKYGVFKGYSRNGVNETTGEYGTILYRKDRFEFIRGGTFWLSDTPDEKSKYEESSHLRICTYVILTDKSNGKDLMFCNLHLSGGRTAEKQIKVVTKYLADEFEKYPVFLTGDFNAHPDSSTCLYLETVMQDSYVTAEKNLAPIPYTAHDYGALTNAYRIDFCWHKGNFKCLNYNTITDMYDGYVSDHYAIMSEFEWV